MNSIRTIHSTKTRPQLSTVLLNWNRVDLLRKTVESYLRTVTVDYELIIVDNASSDGSRAFIQDICETHADCRAVLLSHNYGGEAINAGIERSAGEIIHVSENDLEYLPGWDGALLAKFGAFRELGQLSVFSPFHQIELGEIWTDKAGIRCTSGEQTLYWATDNVGTSSLFRRNIWEKGCRWKSHGSQNFQTPDDHAFSCDVKELGYRVAWNDRYVVINRGHHIDEMCRRLNYYFNNAESKPYLGIEKFEAALSDHGYEIVSGEGRKTVRQVLSARSSIAWARTELWKQWMECLRRAVDELKPLIPDGASFAFIDEQQFGDDVLPGRRRITFPTCDGCYCGPPGDDDTAISELEQLRASGMEWFVVAWPSFWWSDHYTAFWQHLLKSGIKVLENDRVRVFQLH